MTAFSLTYNSLFNEVLSFTERTDTAFQNEIPNFIAYAEKQIAAEFKSLWNLQVANTTITALTTPGYAFYSFPARTRKVVSVSINGAPIYERTADYCKMISAELTAQQPLFWGYFDYNNYIIAPNPDQAYPLQLIYQEQVQPLSSDNQENLITREMPQLMLYGTLVQASLWQKNTDTLQYWTSMYSRSVEALKAEEQNRLIDRNTSAQGASA